MSNRIKSYLYCLLPTMLACIATPSFADGPYFGIGFANSTATETSVSYTSFNGIFLGGYQINDFFAIEGEASMILSKDTVVVSGVSIDAGTRHTAFYLLGSIPFNDGFSLHGRLGTATGTAEASTAGLNLAAAESGTAYGVGFQFGLSENMNLRADYTSADFGTTDGAILTFMTVSKF